MNGNLFDHIPKDLPDEVFQTLAQSKSMKIERIISRGHATPDGEWYDQSQNEWVILLSGAALLTIEGRPEPVKLTAGDYLMLEAGLRHRVDWTDPDQESVWLAVHFS